MMTNQSAAALRDTERQVSAADAAEDHLTAESINYLDAITGATRHIHNEFSTAGYDPPAAEHITEVYVRAVRNYAQACAVAAAAARTIGDTHATMLGIINRGRRKHGLTPITSIRVS